MKLDQAKNIAKLMLDTAETEEEFIDIGRRIPLLSKEVLMIEFYRRYGRLSDHLYKFISALASVHPRPDWPEPEEIEMALRFFRRLENLHDKEKEFKRRKQHQRRQARLEKKKADVVKLVTDDNAKPKTPA